MKKYYKGFICVALILVMVLTSCSDVANKESTVSLQDSSGSDNYVKKDSLNYGLYGEPQSLDPQMVMETIAGTVLNQVFDRLVHQQTDGKIVPGLAESWELSQDGKELTFNLRKGVKFHNGETMTSEDVAYSINRSIKSKYSQYYTTVMDSAEVIDDNTVKINLVKPYGPILNILSIYATSIVSKKAVEEDPEGFARHPIGTGAYKFVEWNNGEKIVLERFDDYYKGQPSIKNLNFKIIVDSSTAVLALENGELDFLANPPQTDKENLKNNDKLSYYETDHCGMVYICFNNEKGLFSNKKIREAISYAIDRESMVIGALEGYGTPLEAPIPIACFGYPKDFKFHPYDIKKAKQLLAEAGYPNGLKIKIRAMETPTYYKPVEVLQGQLKAIGIDAEIEKMERGAYLSDVYSNHQYEITVLGIQAGLEDADVIYTLFHSSTIETRQNYFRCNIPRLDEVLDIGRTSSDEVERLKAYKEVCQIVKDEIPMIPLYCATADIATDKNLKGVQAGSLQTYYVVDYSW